MSTHSNSPNASQPHSPPTPAQPLSFNALPQDLPQDLPHIKTPLGESIEELLSQESVNTELAVSPSLSFPHHTAGEGNQELDVTQEHGHGRQLAGNVPRPAVILEEA